MTKCDQKSAPWPSPTFLSVANKTFSFNHYLPMKDIILDLLNQDVDLTQTSSPIVKFRELLLEHFKRFELTEETYRLAKTASLVDPTHMIKAPEEDLPELIDHVVQILQQDVPAAADPETQEVGPSQPIVSTSVNVPKPRGSKPKSAMALYLNPSFGVAKNKSKPGPVKQQIVRTPIKELVMHEVWAFYENVHANQHDIMTKVDTPPHFGTENHKINESSKNELLNSKSEIQTDKKGERLRVILKETSGEYYFLRVAVMKETNT